MRRNVKLSLGRLILNAVLIILVLATCLGKLHYFDPESFTTLTRGHSK